MFQKLLPGMLVPLLLVVVPRGLELSSSSFMLCWASGPQSSPEVGKCLCGQVSDPKDEGQSGGKARERLPFQPQSGLRLVSPHAHGHRPSPAHNISPQITTEASVQAS